MCRNYHKPPLICLYCSSWRADSKMLQRVYATPCRVNLLRRVPTLPPLTLTRLGRLFNSSPNLTASCRWRGGAARRVQFRVDRARARGGGGWSDPKLTCSSPPAFTRPQHSSAQAHSPCCAHPLPPSLAPASEHMHCLIRRLDSNELPSSFGARPRVLPSTAYAGKARPRPRHWPPHTTRQTTTETKLDAMWGCCKAPPAGKGQAATTWVVLDAAPCPCRLPSSVIVTATDPCRRSNYRSISPTAKPSSSRRRSSASSDELFPLWL